MAEEAKSFRSDYLARKRSAKAKGRAPASPRAAATTSRSSFSARSYDPNLTLGPRIRTSQKPQIAVVRRTQRDGQGCGSKSACGTNAWPRTDDVTL